MDVKPNIGLSKEIHWSESKSLGGNLFQMAPRPQMLLPNGVLIHRSFRPTGKRSYQQNALPNNGIVHYLVRYDREYIAGYLWTNLLSKLPGITHKDAREILVAAFKYGKQ